MKVNNTAIKFYSIKPDGSKTFLYEIKNKPCRSKDREKLSKELEAKRNDSIHNSET